MTRPEPIDAFRAAMAPAARLAPPAGTIRNGMGVDVEEWFQVGAFEHTIARAEWDALPTRVARNVDEVLALFAAADIRATFFTLGWVAARNGAMMRRIVDAGHEVASHGWDHARVFTMDAAAFAADLARARRAIEDATGQRVTGYRAPSFSIDARTPWAHAVLAEAGYAYSSSVAPIAHDHYGWRAAPRFAFRPLADSPLVEIPVTTVQLGARRMAAGGGGFFRVLPYGFSRWALGRVNRGDRRPGVFYFHPWEIDPDQPRVSGAPLRSRLRHYANLDGMAGKLARLIRDFGWERMDIIASEQAAQAPVWAEPAHAPGGEHARSPGRERACAPGGDAT